MIDDNGRVAVYVTTCYTGVGEYQVLTLHDSFPTAWKELEELGYDPPLWEDRWRTRAWHRASDNSHAQIEKWMVEA